MNIFKDLFKKLFVYRDKNEYNFTLAESPKEQDLNSSPEDVELPSQTNIYNNLNVNLDYIKVKYNTLINSDIILRRFDIIIRNKEYKALLLFIDGMVDSELINNFILKPLMPINKNDSTLNVSHTTITNNITVKRIKKFNLENYIYTSLLPQNTVQKIKTFDEVTSNVNMGNCTLFIDTLNIAFAIDVKGYETRNIDKPTNEMVIRGAQESFVEKIRTNTSMLRRIINNENLIIENAHVGKINKTKIAICYMKNITNNSLVSEVKYRINNLDVDYIISSGQLEQLIQDNSSLTVPQMLASERPDKACNYLLEGRVVVLVNGSPYCLVMPGVLIDFLASPEDTNIKYQYANLLKIIRLIATFITLLLPRIICCNYKLSF